MTERLLNLYTQVARPYLDVFPPATCIEQTRVLVEVLRRFNISADGLGVKLVVTYPAGDYQFVSGLDTEDRERGRAVAKAWLERPNSNGEVIGGRHVVALVERLWMIDSTLHQASQPSFGLSIPADVYTIPFDAPLADDHWPVIDAKYTLDEGDEFSVQWIATPTREWEKSDAWEPSHLWPAIDRIEAEMRARL